MTWDTLSVLGVDIELAKFVILLPSLLLPKFLIRLKPLRMKLEGDTRPIFGGANEWVFEFIRFVWAFFNRFVKGSRYFRICTDKFIGVEGDCSILLKGSFVSSKNKSSVEDSLWLLGVNRLSRRLPLIPLNESAASDSLCKDSVASFFADDSETLSKTNSFLKDLRRTKGDFILFMKLIPLDGGVKDVWAGKVREKFGFPASNAEDEARVRSPWKLDERLTLGTISVDPSDDILYGWGDKLLLAFIVPDLVWFGAEILLFDKSELSSTHWDHPSLADVS